MKKLLVAISCFIAIGSVHAEDDDNLLTGDPKLACEAMLCLSTAQPPHECDPALQKFFSIKRTRSANTRKDRRKFLSQCPIAKTQEVEDLIHDLVKKN